jgi:hypothetical protein
MPHIHNAVRYGWHCCHTIGRKLPNGRKSIVCGKTYAHTADIIFRPTMTYEVISLEGN